MQSILLERTIFWLKEFVGTHACDMDSADKAEVEDIIDQLELIFKKRGATCAW